MLVRTFQTEQNKAMALMQGEPDRADYWRGVLLGVRRQYYGKTFNTETEHDLLMSLQNQKGEGYRDGLAVRDPIAK